eukprot:6278520-Pyramimonas_sp.AAC.1
MERRMERRDVWGRGGIARGVWVGRRGGPAEINIQMYLDACKQVQLRDAMFGEVGSIWGTEGYVKALGEEGLGGVRVGGSAETSGSWECAPEMKQIINAKCETGCTDHRSDAKGQLSFQASAWWVSLMTDSVLRLCSLKAMTVVVGWMFRRPLRSLLLCSEWMDMVGDGTGTGMMAKKKNSRSGIEEDKQ